VAHSYDKSTARYVPAYWDEHAERLRLWHKRAHAEGRGKQTCDYQDTRLVVPPEVT
jgi:hypothetical protein